MERNESIIKLNKRCTWLSWRFKGRRGSKSWKRRKGKGSVTERKKEGSELRIGKLKGT
jgi:hypothetical protein